MPGQQPASRLSSLRNPRSTEFKARAQGLLSVLCMGSGLGVDR